MNANIVSARLITQRCIEWSGREIEHGWRHAWRSEATPEICVKRCQLIGHQRVRSPAECPTQTSSNIPDIKTRPRKCPLRTASPDTKREIHTLRDVLRDRTINSYEVAASLMIPECCVGCCRVVCDRRKIEFAQRHRGPTSNSIGTEKDLNTIE